ncbi:helix-turn-helix domain-containing protein [Amycolatopsis sp. CA-126428]|uniref:helix-turn-helix domain-containing protein n=1 Tax=Amycolatopsis sp. CA-126428 TaxID=2073158 RepID=UPI000CD0D69D|nr:helix-turn-helix transcriptional regulator [Amycolatopsis sp. CA-126428]
MTTDSERLAELLRQLRKDSGLSTRELAALSFVSQTKIVRIESGKCRPSPADVDVLTRMMEADPDAAASARELATRTTPAYRPVRFSSEVGWRHEQRDLRVIERSSSSIRFFLPAMLTGLLQTPEYALGAVTGALPLAGGAETIVRDKISRQQALNTTTEFVFLLMPAALRLPLLGRAGMATQWQRLIEISHRPNVTIRLVDESERVLEGPMNTFTVYDDRLVTAELFSGMVTLTEQSDITFHRELFNYFLSVSHTEHETRNLIAALYAH